MTVSQAALALALVTSLVGCGIQVDGAARPVEAMNAAQTPRTGTSSLERIASTISAGHEISTSFAKEKAAAAPAEMYPSF